MQTVSATLAAAITARVREPTVRLRVDWDRSGSYSDLAVKDLSADVSSVSCSRELSTDLPAQAKLFAGLAAAEATVTLAHRDPGGDPAKHAAWYYSGLNAASPLAGYDRKGAPVLLEVGFVTDAGPEYVTILTGYVRSLEPSSGGRTATLRIADGSETMRGQVSLPMIIGDGQLVMNEVNPALSTTFLADWLLRQVGYYASPPPRAKCLLSATLAGSGWPEVGSLYHFTGLNRSQLGYTPGHTTDPARWVMAVVRSGAGQSMWYNLDTTVAPQAGCDNTNTFYFQGWFRFGSAAVDQGMFQALVHGVSEPQISGGYRGETATPSFNVTFCRGGAEGTTRRTLVGPAISPGTGWHFYAVHVTFSSTGATATFRYDNTTFGPVTVSTASVTGQPTLNSSRIGYGWPSVNQVADLDGWAEAVQITSEAAPPSSWDDAFVPSADVIASPGVYYRILATPVTTEEAWSLLQTLAGAEYHTAGFSETGRPYWWPRDRWMTPPYSSPVATLDAKVNLKELASTEATDQVFNKVIIRATQVEVLPNGDVWRATQNLRVNASASRTLWAELTHPTANVDTSVSYIVSPGSSRYHASTAYDGQGTAVSNLSFVVTPFAQSIKIVVTNPNAFAVRLVGNTGVAGVTPGAPSLILAGQPVDFAADNTALRAVASDAGSIARYEEQLLELPANPFRQDIDQVEGLATDLLAALADPPPALQDLPVVADPRLQLGDRVTVVDTEGLALSDEFYLSKIILNVSPGEGMDMVVSLRGAP